MLANMNYTLSFHDNAIRNTRYVYGNSRDTLELVANELSKSDNIVFIRLHDNKANDCILKLK